MDWDWRWFVVPGSALCVLPLVLLLGLLVMRRNDPGARAAVARWWTAVAAGALLAAASKIAFYGWGFGVRAWDLTCFSGHTVLALSLWPVALALPIPPASRLLRRLAACIGVVFALLIGLSRIELGAHPVSEVVAGALLGGGVAAVGLHALRRHWLSPPRTAAVAVLMSAALLATWLGNARYPMLPSERWFATAAAQLASRGEPVDRRHWRKGVTVISPGADAALPR